jgi:hypothetical protein
MEKDQKERQGEQEELLEIGALLTQKFLSVLKGDLPVKASMLNTIRQFLRDQGYSLDEMKRREACNSSMDEPEQMWLPFDAEGNEVKR